MSKKRNNAQQAGWHLILVYFTVFSIWLAAGVVYAADSYPASQGKAVNDFARVIDSTNAAKIEGLAEEVLQKTGTAMVVVTVPELGPKEDINLYVTGLYQAWGIGKKGEDKGVLIFLAVKERKIRIETGYGVEGVLTDGIVGEILDRLVVPHLKTGQPGKALYNAVLGCGFYVAKEVGVQLIEGRPPYRPKSQPQNKGFNIFGLILFLIAAAVLLGTRTGRQLLPWILLMLVSGSGRGGGGGGFGGGFGGFGGGMSGGGGAGRDF